MHGAVLRNYVLALERTLKPIPMDSLTKHSFNKLKYWPTSTNKNNWHLAKRKEVIFIAVSLLIFIAHGQYYQVAIPKYALHRLQASPCFPSRFKKRTIYGEQKIWASYRANSNS